MEKPQIKIDSTDYGEKIHLRFNVETSFTSLALDAEGKLYLSVKQYLEDSIPTYGTLILNEKFEFVEIKELPDGMHLHEVFSDSNQKVWCLGTVEVNEREREVIFDILGNRLNKPKTRPAYSNEQIVFINDSVFVRAFIDDFGDKQGKIVIDPLGDKPKRVNWKIPEEYGMYPRVNVDSDENIHFFSRHDEEALHFVCSLTGELIAKQKIIFKESKIILPVRFENKTSGTYLRAYKEEILLGQNVCGENAGDWTKVLSLPKGCVLFSTWIRFNNNNEACVRFVYGSHESDQSGHGWIYIDSQNKVKSFYSLENECQDHNEKKYPGLEEHLVLIDAAVYKEKVISGYRCSSDADVKNEIVILKQ